VPKIIDYGGRFAFFELACFTLVRDHGVDALSRHGIARVLATSNSLVRRLLHADADLRNLALNEIGVRRRARLGRRPRTTGVEAGMELLRPVLPTRDQDIAEELVWWRLVVAAPSTAAVPPDHESEDGPLHHQFAVASHGYVPSEVFHAEIARPRVATNADGSTDPVVLARRERHEDVRARAEEVIRVVTPEPHDDPEEDSHRATILHLQVDGLGLAVALGDLTPGDALAVARGHLTRLAQQRDWADEPAR
jgi:hypothetical protein